MLPICRLHLAPLAAVLLAASAGAQERMPPGPCTQPGLPEDARCTTVSVPENRDRPDGRQLALHVVVLPARSAAPAREAVAFFAGGPGQASAGLAGPMGARFTALRGTRDLLFVDQRGTGLSAPLQCNLRDAGDPQSYLDDYLPAARAAACRDSLAAFADLTRYGFAEAARDLDAVRQALGYERLDLWGGSYGTRMAQVYQRMYPQRVRSMVLQAVVSPDFLQPAEYGPDLDAALAGLFAECRAEADCHAAFPAVADELRAVAARLESARGEGEILDPVTGRRVRLSLSRGDFAETIRKMMYDPGQATLVPFVVHRAHAGDFRPVLRAALLDRRSFAAAFWFGMYLAITCSEDVPRVDPAAVARHNATTLLGDWRYRQQSAACAGWPRDTPPESYYAPVRSDVPVLLLSGARDPVTPPRWAERVAAVSPNALHVVVPHGGHSYGGLAGVECVDSLTIRFLEAGSARGIDPAPCLSRIRRPPFVIERPEAVAVDQAVLERLAGAWITSGGFEMQVEAIEGALRVRGATFNVVAAPLSPTRFTWEGMTGFEMEFSADGTTLTVRTPRDQLVLTRKP